MVNNSDVLITGKLVLIVFTDVDISSPAVKLQGSVKALSPMLISNHHLGVMYNVQCATAKQDGHALVLTCKLKKGV